MMKVTKTVTSTALSLGLLMTVAACEYPGDTNGDNKQLGYHGTGMNHITNAKYEAVKTSLNQVPEPQYPPEEPGGPSAAEVYENVQVLGHLNELQFTRLMTHITEWVVPDELYETDPDNAGCNYCHGGEEGFAWDGKYQKIVARKMLQMTLNINSKWQDHVGQVGVTCYTCHRGNAVPGQEWAGDVNDLLYWALPADTKSDGRALGYDAGQNHPAYAINSSSLPEDPFSIFLAGDEEIRVIKNDALPQGSVDPGIKKTEYTYSLMTHMSQALGVPCVTCHNSRAFAEWDQSPPQRWTAWYGIRMVRDINNGYMTPLTDVFPAVGISGQSRKGPKGDVYKVHCATCHQNVQKPLYGYPMLKDHPELWGRGAGYGDTAAALLTPPANGDSGGQ